MICVAEESSKPLQMIGSLTAPSDISREAGLSADIYSVALHKVAQIDEYWQ